jgi:hypothetical protein
VVSGFFGGGGGPLEWDADTWRGVVLKTTYSGPPPLVKVRMVRGGPEFLWTDFVCFDVMHEEMEVHEV